MHIITPYNPWAPKKKKTWQEQLWEDQAIAEAEARMLAEAQQSRTLPDNAPPTATATVGPAVNAMAGGGGKPPVQFFHPEQAQANFTRTPLTVAAPAAIQFINTTPNPQLYTYNWEFSDGQTSTEINPTKTFQTGSGVTYSITASLQLTGSGGVAGTRSPNVYTVLSPPVVTAVFTIVSSSNTAPATVTFTNTSTNTSQIPSNTYKWLFGTASLTSTAVTPSPQVYTVAGPYTASLQLTGSYNITSSFTASFRLA